MPEQSPSPVQQPEQHEEWLDLHRVHGPNPDRGQDCPICQNELENDEPALRHSACNNRFHAHCLENWISEAARAGRNPNCPMCRMTFRMRRARTLSSSQSDHYVEEEIVLSPAEFFVRNRSNHSQDEHDTFARARNRLHQHHNVRRNTQTLSDVDAEIAEIDAQLEELEEVRQQARRERESNHRNQTRNAPLTVPGPSQRGSAYEQARDARSLEQTLRNAQQEVLADAQVRIDNIQSTLPVLLRQVVEEEARRAVSHLAQSEQDPTIAVQRLRNAVRSTMNWCEEEILNLPFEIPPTIRGHRRF